MTSTELETAVPEETSEPSTAPEITVIGFPKCGTSALMRCLESDESVDILRAPDGALEVSWPLIKDLRPEPDPDRILAHKFVAYFFSKTALKHLCAISASSIVVLCVRDPARSLVSWHNMHRSIARSGNNKAHFAWKERDFYADCSIEDYYERYARKNLQYDEHLRKVLSVVPRERLAVVAQERMADDLDAITVLLKDLARGVTGEAPSVGSSPPSSTDRHESFAERADVDFDETIREELQEVRSRLAALIDEEVVHRFV